MRNTIFSGFTFVLIAVFYYLFWDSISFISLILFVIGIILVLSGFLLKKYGRILKNYQLIMIVSLPVLMIAVLLFWQNREFKQTVILPEDYSGLVIIYYQDENLESTNNVIKPVIVGDDGIGKAAYQRKIPTLEGLHIFIGKEKEQSEKLSIRHFINYQPKDSLKVNAFLAADLGDILSLVVCKNINVNNYFEEGSTPVLKDTYKNRLNNFVKFINNSYE